MIYIDGGDDGYDGMIICDKFRVYNSLFSLGTTGLESLKDTSLN